MKRLLAIPLYAFLSALLLTSCATTTLKDSWRNESVAKRTYHKLLVVSVNKNEATRRVLEDVLVAELKLKGVEALPGSAWVPVATQVVRPELEQALKASGAEGVLTVQTVRTEKQTNYSPGYVSTYPGYWYPPAYNGWDFYGYYGNTYYYPPTAYTYEIATIQANLFDAGNSVLVWAASVESTETGNLVALGKNLATIIVHSLSSQGLI